MNTDLYIVEWMIADPLASNAEAEAFAKKTLPRAPHVNSIRTPIRGHSFPNYPSNGEVGRAEIPAFLERIPVRISP